MRRIIDRSLNWGRQNIKYFAEQSKSFDNVLDIGAGKGFDLSVFKNINPNATLFAVENHGPNVEILRSRGIITFSIDIERERLPFENGSVDIIVINQVLEHVKDIFWIMNEISRVLSVNGRLIIGVPNLASLHNRLLLCAGIQPTCIQTNSAHVRGYTKRSIEKLLNIWPNGYDLIFFKGSNFYPFPPSLANFLSRAFPSLSVSIFMCLQKTKEYTDNEYISFPVTERLETNFFLGPTNQDT